MGGSNDPASGSYGQPFSGNCSASLNDRASPAVTCGQILVDVHAVQVALAHQTSFSFRYSCGDTFNVHS